MSATAPIDGVTLDDYIRARAKLQRDPDDVGAILTELSLPDIEAWRRVERAWRERTEQNERLATVVNEFLSDYTEAPEESPSRGDEAGNREELALVRHDIPSYLKETAASDAVPATAARRPAAATSADLDLTQPPLRRVAGATLPFVRGVDVPAEVRAAWAEVKRADAAGEKEVGGATTGPDQPDETAILPRSLFTEAPRATPFEAAAPASTSAPRMPMEEYASFLAELAQDQAREGLLRAKYGIEGERAQRAIGAEFAAVFQREPAQRARFDALLAERRGALSSRVAATATAMTMETYAKISAAMAGGDEAELVLARFGLRGDDWAAAMRQMSERFAAEPQLRVAYQELVRRARVQGST